MTFYNSNHYLEPHLLNFFISVTTIHYSWSKANICGEPLMQLNLHYFVELFITRTTAYVREKTTASSKNHLVMVFSRSFISFELPTEVAIKPQNGGEYGSILGLFGIFFKISLNEKINQGVLFVTFFWKLKEWGDWISAIKWFRATGFS